MNIQSADLFVTDGTQRAHTAFMFSAYNTVLTIVCPTVGTKMAIVTKLILGECLAAFRAMVLFVAIARLRVIGAVGSAVAEPVVKSVAAAILTFGAVLVACMHRQYRGRKHPDHYYKSKHDT